MIQNCKYCGRPYSNLGKESTCKSCGAALEKDDFTKQMTHEEVSAYLREDMQMRKKNRKRIIFWVLTFFLFIPVGGLITVLIGFVLFSIRCGM